MVGEALKGGRLVAEVFHDRGAAVFPPPAHHAGEKTPTPSFITAVCLGSPEAMGSFSRAVQRKSPVGSYVRPLPGEVWSGCTAVLQRVRTLLQGRTSEKQMFWLGSHPPGCSKSAPRQTSGQDCRLADSKSCGTSGLSSSRCPLSSHFHAQSQSFKRRNCCRADCWIRG